MPKREVKVNFFRLVDGEDNPIDLPEYLDSVIQLPEAELNYSYYNDYLRLNNWETSPSKLFKYGLLVRLRRGSDARKAKLYKREIGYVELSSDEVLSEWTYFIYEPNRKTIISTVNRFAASPEALSEYVSNKSGRSNIDVAYYPTGDLIQRLYALSETQKIHVKIAVPDNKGVFDEQIFFPDLFLEDMVNQKAKSVEVTIRAESGGFEEGFRGQVNKLLRIVNKQNAHIDSGRRKPAKLTVFGKKEDNARDEINFVNDRLHSLASVDYKGKYPTHNDYWTALIDAYGAHKPDIERWFTES